MYFAVPADHGGKRKESERRNKYIDLDRELKKTTECHVISHGDDRNKINTILPLEWTVATRQKSDR